MSRRKKAAVVILALVFLLAVFAIIAAVIYRNRLLSQSTTMSGTASETGSLGKWQEGVIEYKGQKYRYNNKLKIYLMLGIDTDEKVHQSASQVEGGQSDALFLLVADPDTKTIKVVSIHRNTMTDIYVCEADGNFVAYTTAQICVQHGFGDGMKLSCSRTVTAVEKLFDGLPIDGYVSVNMGAIPLINDAVGGVTLEVLDDLDTPDGALTKGQTVTLTGDQAYAYIRSRDTDVEGSATERLRRQEQFITKFLEQVKGNSSLLTSLYDSISDYTVTDLMLADEFGALSDYIFDSENVYTVPGDTVMGEKFEEYYVDEDAFRDLIIDIFYIEK